MPKTCTHTNCNNPVFSKAKCITHWKQEYGKPIIQSKLNKLTKGKVSGWHGKAIKRVSDKQEKLNTQYSKQATAFKNKRGLCEARLQNCTHFTDHVHHLHSGASRSKYFLDETTWLPVCNHCHHIIHDVLSKEDAINMGFKRLDK